ncbi:MAG: DUF5615 family PIN-like protein [Isosphaeraceae bacterium]
MTSVLVKLDENLGQSHAELVRRAGHAVERVTDEGLSGAIDPVVWQRVVAEGRFFVTLDLDFSDVRQFPPGSHPGLLLIRPRTNSRDAVSEILERVLRDHPLDTLRGCLVVADASLTRIRRPPPPEPSS